MPLPTIPHAITLGRGAYEYTEVPIPPVTKPPTTKPKSGGIPTSRNHPKPTNDPKPRPIKNPINAPGSAPIWMPPKAPRAANDSESAADPGPAPGPNPGPSRPKPSPTPTGPFKPKLPQEEFVRAGDEGKKWLRREESW